MNLQKKLRIGIIGEPNSGKSTLTNSLIGSNISMVSSKPHTTRDATLAVLTEEDTQLILIDTPGIGLSKREEETNLYTKANNAAKTVDLLIFLFDGTKKIPGHILEMAETNIPKIAIFNKIDLINKSRLLTKINILSEYFSDIRFISALSKEGLKDFKKELFNRAQPGEWDFNVDFVTPKHIDVILSEKTQEIIFELFNDELPYTTKVKTLDIEEKESGVRIQQVILINKKHRSIFISKVKEISIKSRMNMEKFLNKKAHLFIRFDNF